MTSLLLLKSMLMANALAKSKKKKKKLLLKPYVPSSLTCLHAIGILITQLVTLTQQTNHWPFWSFIKLFIHNRNNIAYKTKCNALDLVMADTLKFVRYFVYYWLWLHYNWNYVRNKIKILYIFRKPIKKVCKSVNKKCRICDEEDGEIPIFNNFVHPNLSEEILNFSGVRVKTT